MVTCRHMFCDELKIKVIAGKGGNGCSSFRREKFVPKGGPDGGDGGNGGDVIIKVNKNLSTLNHLAHSKTYRADKGVPGKGKKMHGKNAEDLIIEVPMGTIVFNEDKSQQLADLSKEGAQTNLAKGGKGGLGNARFVSSTHQAPRFAETGEPGEELEVVLELKMVADIGIIGLPSAGKSTLISVISNARPKIAAYHFTTLSPNLGVVSMSQFEGRSKQSFIVADIPGLIEGASEGKGLGHQFLKHISRTKLHIHLLDGTEEDLVKNYKTIVKELKDFDKELAKKEEIIVINKIDMLTEEEISVKIKKLKKATKKKNIYTISGITREGLKPMVFEAIELLEILKKKAAKEGNKVIEKPPVLKPHLEKVKFMIDSISKENDHKIFKISGKRIDQILVMTEISNREGLERVYQFMDKMGIKKAIEKKGATFGDIIEINNKRLPYRK